MNSTLIALMLTGTSLVTAVEVGVALAQVRPPSLVAHVNGDAPASEQQSLFQLRTRFTSADGGSVTLADQRGGFQVLALIFTRCPTVCPTLVKDLQRLEQALPEAARDRTKFVLFSIDPEHDTPEVLRSYRDKMGLDPKHFLLLRGTQDQIRELSATLGASYGSGQGQALTHSRLITLLGPEGEILHQRLGLGEPRTFVDLIQTTRTPS